MRAHPKAAPQVSLVVRRLPPPRRQPEIRMTEPFRIYRATPEPAVAEALAEILLDCVEGGASVGFMHPLPRAKALAFWQTALASAARGERIVLVAEDVASNTIVGTGPAVLAP